MRDEIINKVFSIGVRMSKQINFGDTVFIKRVEDDYHGFSGSIYNGEKHIKFTDDTYHGYKYGCDKVTVLAVASDGSWLLSNGCQTYMLDGIRTVSQFLYETSSDGRFADAMESKKGDKIYIHFPVLTQEECMDYLEYRYGWDFWNQAT